MITERRRCWLKHKYRENWDFCPLCNAPLRWFYDGEEWIPCDREPVSFKRGLEGDVLIVSESTLKNYCILYAPGDKGQFRLGLLPHVFSCDELHGYHGVKVER
jgi:hypothetical protein